jgi:hypothetical protein
MEGCIKENEEFQDGNRIPDSDSRFDGIHGHDCLCRTGIDDHEHLPQYAEAADSACADAEQQGHQHAQVDDQHGGSSEVSEPVGHQTVHRYDHQGGSCSYGFRPEGNNCS